MERLSTFQSPNSALGLQDTYVRFHKPPDANLQSTVVQETQFVLCDFLVRLMIKIIWSCNLPLFPLIMSRVQPSLGRCNALYNMITSCGLIDLGFI